MKNSEKLTVAISLVAILVSIGTPIATYFWLDPSQKELLYRGQLVVVNSDEDLSRGDSAEYSTVILRNAGQRPADGVLMSVQFKPGISPAKPFFTRDPIEYEIRSSEIFVQIKISTPVAPGASIGLHFHPSINAAYAITKFGDVTKLWGNGFLGGGSTSD